MCKYLGGASEAITALADGDVEHELLDLDLPHRVRLLLLRRLQSQKPKPETTHDVRNASTRGPNDSTEQNQKRAVLRTAHIAAASLPWGRSGEATAREVGWVL
jgi:hypothetical protein